jgi:hypothetical protein
MKRLIVDNPVEHMYKTWEKYGAGLEAKKRTIKVLFWDTYTTIPDLGQNVNNLQFYRLCLLNRF